MLDYFEMKEESALIKEGVNWILEHKFFTKDIDAVNFYFTSTIGEMLHDYILEKIPAGVHHDNIALRKSTII
jgi:3-isopropylmalate dehydrogenase